MSDELLQERFEQFFSHLKMIGGIVAVQILTQHGEKIPSNNIWVDTSDDTALGNLFVELNDTVGNNITESGIHRCYVSSTVNRYGEALNDKGNRTRKKTNVIAPSFVTIDIDSYTSYTTLELLKDKLKPTSIVVTSERDDTAKTHWYWKINDSELDLETYDFLCKLVCHKLEDTLCILSDTERLEHCVLVDEGASGRSAFLRLPGFWHNKIEGQKTLTHTYYYNEDSEIINVDDWLINPWGIDEEFITYIKELPDRRNRTANTLEGQQRAGLIATDTDYLGDIEGHALIAEGRNASLYSYCLHILYRKKKLSLKDAELELIAINKSRHLRPLDDYEVVEIAKSAFEGFKAGQNWYAEQKSKIAIEAKEKITDKITSGVNPLPSLPHMQYIQELVDYYDTDSKFTGVYNYKHPDFNRGKTTDSSIVRRFIDRFSKYVKFVSVIDSTSAPQAYYYSPNTGKWCLDPILVEGLLRILITQIDPRDIYMEFPNKDHSYSTSIASATKWILSKVKATSIDEALRELKTKSELRMSQDAFDKNKALINMNSYVFNVTNQTCLPHSSSYFFTKGMTNSIAFDPSKVEENLALKTRETWQLNKFTRFIIQITRGDTELANYLQKMFGYCLLAPEKNLQQLFFCTGVGDNGKSVLIETIEDTFRGLTAQIDSSVLASGKAELSNAAMSSLAQTKGTKTVFVSELEDGITWRSSVVKKLTGDSAIIVKRSHKDTEALTIDYAIIVSGNNKPKFAETNGSNHSMWRRLTVVPFHFKVEEKDKNYNLRNELLAEKENVFHWVIAGYKKFLAEGLKYSVAMQDEKDEYREAEGDLDSVSFIPQFLAAYFQPYHKDVTANEFYDMGGELLSKVPYKIVDTNDTTFTYASTMYKAYLHYLKEIDVALPPGFSNRKFYALLKEMPGVASKLFPTRQGMKMMFNLSIKKEYVELLQELEAKTEVKSNVVNLQEKLKQFGYNKKK